MLEKNRMRTFVILEIIVATLGIGALCKYAWAVLFNGFMDPSLFIKENTFSKFTNLSNVFVSVDGLLRAT